MYKLASNQTCSLWQLPRGHRQETAPKVFGNAAASFFKSTLAPQLQRQKQGSSTIPFWTLWVPNFNRDEGRRKNPNFSAGKKKINPPLLVSTLAAGHSRARNAPKKKRRGMNETEGEKNQWLTNLDGGDAEPAGLEHDADAARGHALAEAAHHPSCHQHVLHGGSSN